MKRKAQGRGYKSPFQPNDKICRAIYLATGSYIAARAGNRVFLGHWAETMNYAQKMEEAKTFFGPASDEWRKELLRDYNISYPFYGPRERAPPALSRRGNPISWRVTPTAW